MLRHRWKILIGITLVFVLVTGIELAIVGNGPKKEVEAYKKSLIANGERLKISELVPPPVPPEQNGADIVNEAFGLLTPEDRDYSNSIPAMRMIGPGKAIVCFEQPAVRDELFTNSWVNELAIMADDQPMTELLRQVTNYPAIDFQLIYEDRPAVDRYLEPLFFAADRLSAGAICNLHQGDAASAAVNISVILALVKGLDDERLDAFQLRRIYMTWLAADATWELLQSSNVCDGELSGLQRSWEGPEYIHGMENAFAMQRAFSESEILKMRASNEYFNRETRGFEEDVDWSADWRDVVDSLENNSRLAFAKSVYRASWTYSDELRMLKKYGIVLEMLRTVETNRFFFAAYTRMTNELSAYEADEPEDWLTKLDDSYLHRMFSGEAFEAKIIGRTAEAEATRRMTITAITLKRYQLKYGNYPSSLGDLVPQFVSSIPRDPIDGKPLRYRRMTDGTFILYSIGLNGKDDGGDGSMAGKTWPNRPPHLTNPDALDWVWPQPATPAEIQAFYAHPPGP